MLMIFAQMLEIVALSDFTSVLYARKFSFDFQVGFTRRWETSALRACLYRKIYRESRISEIPYYLWGCSILQDVIQFSFHKKRWLRDEKLF